MAHVRRRGARWQAIVKLSDGRTVSRSDPLKRVVEAWAREVETDIRRGRWNDPRPGKAMTVSAWRASWSARRVVEPVTRAKDDSHWRTRIEPRWGEVALRDVRRSAVQEWVGQMGAEGLGAHTIAGTVNHLGAMLQAAVEAEPPLLTANPARGIDLPRTDAGRLRFFTRSEYAAIDAALAGREPYRTLVELGCFGGLRWGELAGLDWRDVDLPRQELHVRQVLTRSGLRRYGKSTRSHRTVPLRPHLVQALGGLGPPRGLVFTQAAGQELDESNFRGRVWRGALQQAGVEYAPPHTMRHTAASWLVMAGVDLYRVQALLGHESPRTTARYAHLAPDAHDALRSAWESMAMPVTPVSPDGVNGGRHQSTSNDA